MNRKESLERYNREGLQTELTPLLSIYNRKTVKFLDTKEYLNREYVVELECSTMNMNTDMQTDK